MRIVLVRHGTAITATHRMRDEDRYLTSAGRGDAVAMGATLVAAGWAPTLVFTSPLVRAVQTAELLARAFGPVDVRVHEPLAVDEGTPRQAVAVLEGVDAHATVVLVTHEPKVRSIAALLGRTDSFSGFPTCGVALFEGPREALVLRGRLDPSSSRGASGG